MILPAILSLAVARLLGRCELAGAVYLRTPYELANPRWERALQQTPAIQSIPRLKSERSLNNYSHCES